MAPLSINVAVKTDVTKIERDGKSAISDAFKGALQKAESDHGSSPDTQDHGPTQGGAHDPRLPAHWFQPPPPEDGGGHLILAPPVHLHLPEGGTHATDTAATAHTPESGTVGDSFVRPNAIPADPGGAGGARIGPKGPSAKPEVAIPYDFPDPTIVNGPHGTQYAYATGSGDTGGRDKKSILQMSVLKPGGTWSTPEPVQFNTAQGAPKIPSWVDTSQAIWAPDVHEVGTGKGKHYIMYFSAVDNNASGPGNHRAIGYATSGSPGGPWTIGSTPLPLNPKAAEGGAIDPSLFTNNGHNYIVWKNAGDSVDHGNPPNDTIWLQPVSDDGQTLKGQPTPLLTNTPGRTNNQGQPVPVVQQGQTIEAPQMVYHDGKYVLFYSSGSYNNGTTSRNGPYTEHYATANSPTGPWRLHDEPLLQTGGETTNNGLLQDPGGATILDNNTIAFQNYRPDQVNGSGREMMEAKLQWDKNGMPFVDAPADAAVGAQAGADVGKDVPPQARPK